MSSSASTGTPWCRPTTCAPACATLEATGADNVGGIMAAEGTNDFERAVARAMTSRFGVGGASFHVGGEPGPALTVYLGCFRRAALERVGGYDESMVRAQDWEMNLRIRQTGGVVWFTPDMHVTYRPRHTLKALARQYHDYGRWRREVSRRHPETLSAAVPGRARRRHRRRGRAGAGRRRCGRPAAVADRAGPVRPDRATPRSTSPPARRAP